MRALPGRRVILVSLGGLLGLAILYGQRPFRVLESMEPYDNVALPADYAEQTEWVFGRLMYPPHPNARFGRWRNRRDWTEGGTSWTQDYPRADRSFSMALRRLTRIHVRSVEQPVNLDDDDDVYNYPFLFAGEMGDWLLTDSQAAKLRVFPDRQIVEIPADDPITRTVYTITERKLIPGQWGLRRGTWYRNDGSESHWRGIYDDQNRLMVAMLFNNDVGDAWEWADDASYPEPLAALGIRLGVNFAIYSMTH
jgi:hypothetical protein